MAPVNGPRRRRSGGGARRVFFLAVVGLVALSLTFILGILVGHKWARGRPPQVASVEARKPHVPRRALSDVEAVKPPQVQEKLTFYQTLTAPLGATPPPARPERAGPPAKPREETPTERTRAEGTGTRGLPDAAPAAEAGREGPAPAAEPVYTVQVVAYRARPTAEEMERKLKGAGFDAYVTSVSGADGRTTYRVRVGGFATRGEAERMAERLRHERGLGAFVTAR